MDAVADAVLRSVEHERVARPKARRAGDILPSVDAVTTDWLTDVLCRDHPGAAVVAFQIEPVSTGTHDRHRLRLTYDDEGERSGLPDVLFTKTLPTAEHRMIAGITGHARTEGLFYTQLRPDLDLEIPLCYESTVDRDSYAAFHLLEDVVATKGAVFTDAETLVTREMAEDMIDLIAVVHGRFHNDPRFANELRWVAPFAKWFRGGIKKIRVDHYHEQAMTQAAAVIPDRLMKRREEVWPAALEALRVHEERPSTFLHSDVHIGNWYQTAAGRMGLCDWQCAARGHWSRDVAYLISAALRVEDRRAWEQDLLRRYLDRLSQASGQRFDFDESFRFYRQQMFHALMMWTPTLCHSEHLPNMQPEWISLAMIERMTTAIDDLDSIGSCY
jgi:hypothetical protein